MSCFPANIFQGEKNSKSQVGQQVPLFALMALSSLTSCQREPLTLSVCKGESKSLSYCQGDIYLLSSCQGESSSLSFCQGEYFH